MYNYFGFYRTIIHFSAQRDLTCPSRKPKILIRIIYLPRKEFKNPKWFGENSKWEGENPKWESENPKRDSENPKKENDCAMKKT